VFLEVEQIRRGKGSWYWDNLSRSDSGFGSGSCSVGLLVGISAIALPEIILNRAFYGITEQTLGNWVVEPEL
jgi:hypothetical protein